jgi:predicted O-methyltransferase YrrM
MLQLLLMISTAFAQKTDAVYAIGVPFEIDGTVQQIPLIVRAGQSPADAVLEFCTIDRPLLCNNNDNAVTSQILDIVQNTIRVQRQQLYPNDILRSILETKQVSDASGNVIQLDSNIAPDEGKYLYNLITTNNMTRTLEVGMAYGVSALYIAQAHKDLGHTEQVPRGHADDASSYRHHVAIDPFQSTQWASIGSFNLMKAGLRHLVSLVEQESHFALPHLTMHQASMFDLCFIDGMHLFDYTLVDFYYSDLLVREGGYVVFDDAHMPSVQKVIAHALKNRAYVQVDNGLNNQRVITLQKVRNDDRRWDYHVNF